MRIYIGERYFDCQADFVVRVWVDVNGDQRPLNPRFDLRKHSPDGFEWGYLGSGPAQLALALCADATGDDEMAQEVYQEYKRRVVARLATREWTLTIADVLAVVHQIEHERETR